MPTYEPDTNTGKAHRQPAAAPGAVRQQGIAAVFRDAYWMVLALKAQLVKAMAWGGQQEQQQPSAGAGHDSGPGPSTFLMLLPMGRMMLAYPDFPWPAEPWAWTSWPPLQAGAPAFAQGTPLLQFFHRATGGVNVNIGIPITIANVFGMPSDVSYCPNPAGCHDPVQRTRFWGGALAAVDMGVMFTGRVTRVVGGAVLGEAPPTPLSPASPWVRLRRLREEGLEYQLLVPASVVLATASPAADMVVTHSPGAGASEQGQDQAEVVTASAIALLEAQESPSLSLQGLSAPGMCASQLLTLNTTGLLNTSLTAQELMPGLGYFATDVAQLLRDHLQDSSIQVQVPDFCAGNRTVASFIDNGTRVSGPWPTLNVTINLLTTEPERLSSPIGPLRQLLVNCRGALTRRDSLGFFNRYGMPFHRCQAALLPNSPPPSPSLPPSPPPSPSPSPPAPPPPGPAPPSPGPPPAPPSPPAPLPPSPSPRPPPPSPFPPLPPQPPPSPPLPPTNSQLLTPPVDATKSLPSPFTPALPLAFTPPSLACPTPSLT
ncbi:hypothetical protein V8C86DRAFT_3090530 [Haematococcus lacustris]